MGFVELVVENKLQKRKNTLTPLSSLNPVLINPELKLSLLV
jgi:hypothetical protein